MSTLKATNLQHASATSPNIVLGSDGSVAVGGGNISPQTGFRNRIINGDMRIDQRNAGASVAASNSAYSLDRWRTELSGGGAFTFQRSTTAPAGFNNSMLLTVTTADASIASADYYDFQQFVEGFNVADLGWGTASAQTVTISFWVRSSVTGTFAGSVGNGAANRSYVFTYTVNAANTFEYKTVTIPGDTAGTWRTDNGRGISLIFDLGNGSNYQASAGLWVGQYAVGTASSVKLISTAGATFYITGVQLEKGSVATPFEFRSIGQELALCQRYYQNSGSITLRGLTPVLGGTSPNTIVSLPVTMRSAPTVTVVTDATGGYVWGSAAATGFTVEWPNSSGLNSKLTSYTASSEI